MSEQLTELCGRATAIAENLHGLRKDMGTLFSDYEKLYATYYDDEHERDKDTLNVCMEEVGDAYKALKYMMSRHTMENNSNNNLYGGARRKHRKTRHRKTKKRQTRRHH